MKLNLATVLDNCIAELRKGKTPEQCLSAYKDAPADLLPLLKTAAAVYAAPKAQASEAAMRSSKVAFLQEAARLRAEQQKRHAKPWQRLPLVASQTFVLPRIRLAWTPAFSVVIALVLVLCSATTTMAAARSLPDEPLYPIKLATEQVQLALTTDPVARADLSITLAEKRLGEIATMTSLGRTVEAPSIERLSSDTTIALSSISRIDDEFMRPLLQRYVEMVSEQQNVLNQVKSPPSLVSAVTAALTIAQENEKLAATAISDPSTLKDDPARSGRAVVADPPKETATALPTADTPVIQKPAPAATATEPPATPTPLPAATHTATPLPPTATSTVTASATTLPSPTALPRIRFGGVIESVSASAWVIDGRTVQINGQTGIDGAPARAGARADVVAVTQAQGTLLAITIHVYPAADTPVPVALVRGIILSIGPTAWNIGGQTVAVDGATVVNGTPVVGAIAQVTAWRQTGDTQVAAAIVVRGTVTEVTIGGRIERMASDSWVIGGKTVSIISGLTTISGSPTIGHDASVAALRQDDGSLLALRITVQAPIIEEEFEGVINRIDGSVWTISGRRVMRGPSTTVDESVARAQVGGRARVRGALQSDASILASSIRILGAGGTGRQASPTVVVSPTLTVLPTVTVLPTLTVLPTVTVPPTPTVLPTITVVPTITVPPAATAQPTPTIPPSATPVPTLSPAPTCPANPTAVVTQTVSPTPAVKPTELPTRSVAPEPPPLAPACCEEPVAPRR